MIAIESSVPSIIALPSVIWAGNTLPSRRLPSSTIRPPLGRRGGLAGATGMPRQQVGGGEPVELGAGIAEGLERRRS